ncbi:MAG: hypothetical protein HZA22_09030 [Nitrospirae bacterium]|nr:hypothetical protein [Nitrospirota bacterium]
MKMHGAVTAVSVLLSVFILFASHAAHASIFDIFGPPPSDTRAVQQKKAAPAKPAAKKASPAPAPAPTFTVSKVVPTVKERKLTIYFTEPVSTSGLDASLKVFPPVEMEWYNASAGTDNSLSITGNFRPGQTYRLTFSEGFRSVTGKKFVKGVDEVLMPNLPSEITVPDKGSVIERDGRQLLNLKVTNADELVFSGLNLPPVLLPAAAEAVRVKPGTQVMPWDEIKAGLIDKHGRMKKAAGGDADFAPLLADITEDRDAFFSKGEYNEPRMFSMPLTFRQAGTNGTILLARIDSRTKDQPAEGLVKLLCVSDTSITYKLSAGSILIWTSSISTGLPVPDAAVLLFTKDNTAFYAGRTDRHGLLTVEDGAGRKSISINDPARGIAQRALAVNDVVFAAASTEDDASYVEVRPTGNIRVTDVTQTKAASRDEALRNAAVFTERGVYRPGETVFFKGASRQYAKGEITSPVGLECRFTITDPRNQQVYDRRLKLSEFGTANGSFVAERYMPVGEYTLKIHYGPTDAESETATFRVHEFQPPRHFTRIGFKRMERELPGLVNVKRTGDYVECTVEGVYYAGGPVKNGRVRWIARKTKTGYDRADYPDYTFGYPEGDGGDDVLESGESVLDASGKVAITVPIGGDVVSGMQGLAFEATVVDFDGRAASGVSTYQAESEVLVGISRHPDYVKSEDSLTLKGVVIDRAGNRVKSGTVRVKVMQRSGASFPKRNSDGEVYWEYQQTWRDRLTADVPVKDGVAVFEFDFAWGGYFNIVFSYKDRDGRRYSSGTTFRVDDYYSYYGTNEGEYINEAERLNLIPDREAYAPGDTARVYFNRRVPFRTALVTVERAGVMRTEVLELEPEQRYIEVPVTKDDYPNVFISVLGTVPRGGFPIYREEVDAAMPGFLFGLVNVDVRRETSGLTVAISPDRKKIKALPGAEVTIELRTSDIMGDGVATEMAVCVVDESVLAMTGFKTPSLAGLNRFGGPLSVFTGDMRRELLSQMLYDMLKVAPLTGGDGGAAGRLAKKLRADFSPVAYFNPAVRTDESGRATVTFRFPDTMTEYRIYAVACDRGSRFGSGEREAVVVKDFYMEPGLPRFFTKGDRFRFDVAAFNRTETDGEAGFTAVADGRLDVRAEEAVLALPAMDMVKAGVSGTAVSPGRSTLDFSGRLGSLEDAVRLTIPVNSGYIIDKDSVFGSLKGGGTVAYDLPKGARDIPEGDINPDEAQAVLTISGSPFTRLVPGLRYLLNYPYGCIEQTSSATLALSGLRGLIVQGLIPGITVAETDKYIKSGVERVISMQVDSGGFSYWPGETRPHLWGSIYATYALTLGRQAGLDVPADRLGKALDYLEQAAGSEGANDLLFRSYAAYILALNGRMNAELVRGINAKLGEKPATGHEREAAVVTLMAIKAGGGMTPELKSLSRGVFEGKDRPDTARDRWPGFYAPFRAHAVETLAASEILPGEKAADDAAKRLMAGMKDGVWTSTSDTGWALVALGSYFKGARFGTEPITGRVMQGGKTVAEFRMRPNESFTTALDYARFAADPKAEVVTDAKGTLIYMLSLSYPRRDYAAKGFSNGFAVSKVIKNLDGSDRVQVGDVVEVKIRVSTEGTDNRYVVVDDPLPAGLVAINSALKTEEHIAGTGGPDGGDYYDGYDGEYYWWSYWEKDGYYRLVPNFMEMKDDRVLVFRDSLWKGAYQYSYYARAVCEGEFVMPPTKVQLMYQPDRVGYTPAGVFKVEGNR